MDILPPKTHLSFNSYLLSWKYPYFVPKIVKDVLSWKSFLRFEKFSRLTLIKRLRRNLFFADGQKLL